MTDRQSHFGSLKSDNRGHNLLVGDNVEIDPSAEIGANVVIHGDVKIGAGCVIKHNCVIGQAPSLSPGSSAVPQEAATTVIGDRTVICNGAVVLNGARIGKSTIIGDYCFVREGAWIGNDTVLGRGTGVGVASRIGDRVRAQGPTGISPLMIVEDDVFISAYLAPITDNSSGRDPAQKNGSVTLRRGCRIGANVSLMPNIEIGEEALVGAGAVVMESVEPRTKVVGAPARVIGMVDDAELLDN